MNQTVRGASPAVRIAASACPHDCPSTCALEVEVLDAHTIGRVRGAPDNAYTQGVICAKGAAGIMKQASPARLTQPLLRKAGSERGAGEFEAVSWERAYAILEERLAKLEMGLEVGDSALAQLAKAGFDPVYGARPLKRAIQQSIENPLAKQILEGHFAAKDTIRVEYRGGAMHFEKSGTRSSQKAATR